MRKVQASEATNILYRTEIDGDDSPALVKLWSTWDHDGTQFPVQDLETVIELLTALRDELAP